MTNCIHATLFFAATAALAACNSFDPQLGTAPFKCGVAEPRCPDDFTCVQQSPGVDLCVSTSQDPSTLPDGGISGQFSCENDNEIEPNNTTQVATQTTIPDQAMTYRLVGLAICPASDQDIFEFRIDGGALATITATAEVGNGDGVIAVEILNELGASVRMGMADPQNPKSIVAQLNNAPVGEIYFVRISGDGVGENNYNIQIEVAQ
jgi:hypothetical protein